MTQVKSEWINPKRVTIFILCYNNEAYLQRALTSVLALDYPNLEIIVSDDCSPNGFSADKHMEFIEKYKKENLQSYLVRREEENVGTVQHLINAMSNFSGEYYMTMGADDFIGIPSTVGKLVRAIENAPQQEYLAVGNVRVLSNNLEKSTGYISDEEKALFLERNAERLLERLTYRCCIPAMGVLYSRAYLQAVGMPDPRFKYTEEWPAFIKMTKLGITPVFVDIIATNQVMGGISNGNNFNNSAVRRQFLQDKQLMWDTLVEPLIDKMPPDVKNSYYERRRREEKDYILASDYAPLGRKQKLLYLIRHPKAIFWVKKIAKQDFLAAINQRCKLWIDYIAVGLACLLTWILSAGLRISSPIAAVVGWLALICGTFCILVGALMLLYKLTWVNLNRWV